MTPLTTELTTEALQRNHGVVELIIRVRDNLLVVSLANNKPSTAPTEIVH